MSVGKNHIMLKPSFSLPVITAQIFCHDVRVGLISSTIFYPYLIALFLCNLSIVDILSMMQAI